MSNEYLNAEDTMLVKEIIRLAKIARTAALARITVPIIQQPRRSARLDTASPVDYSQETQEPTVDGPRPVGHEDIILQTLLLHYLRMRGQERSV
jgi:hypothetical protein